MRKEDKSTIIEKIAATLKEYSCIYLTTTTGLDAEKTSNLRRACSKADIKLMVVKNTLLKRAMEAADIDYSGLYPALSGSTSLMLSNTGSAPAKLIKDFCKKDDVLPALKAAYVEESVYMGADQLDFLASLKSKNELIGEIVAMLESPIKNVISALDSAANTIHGELDTLAQRAE